MVQAEIQKRKNLKGQHSGNSTFSSKIVRADCDNFYGSKVWHSNSKYKNTILQCNKKFKNKKKCRTPHLKEDQIKKLFVIAFNRFLENKNEIIATCKTVIRVVSDTTALEKEKAGLCDVSRLICTKI